MSGNMSEDDVGPLSVSDWQLPDAPSPADSARSDTELEDKAAPDAAAPSQPIQKRRRVTRACDECRRKKIKCDGKQPCTHCSVYSYECTYDKPSNRRRNPAPQYIEALESRLERAESLLRNAGRPKPRPRDLHIRKVSFSGCSLSSACSFASDSSSPTAPSTASTAMPFTPHTARSASLDPRGAHPASRPPPPLEERPSITSPEQPRFAEAATFFVSDDDDDDDFGRYQRELELEYGVRPKEHQQLELPSHLSPVRADAKEPHDYFLQVAGQRPPMPRSRWSYSTIATVDSVATGDDADDADAEHQGDAGGQDDNGESLDSDPEQPQHHEPSREPSREPSYEPSEPSYQISCEPSYQPGPQPSHHSMPNFSYKRATVPKRPPVRTLDSLDDFIKRGGWKRRGIVFESPDDGGCF